MITLLTGQPGHGKTLRALQLATQLHAEGREVFACRVRGLDYEKTGFKELDTLSQWQSLPDGSVVLVDECYEDIPSRGSGKPVPEWEQAMATHRHRGFDFILVCQMGSQISTFVRALIDTHVHVRRKFGLNRSVLLTWDRYCASVASDSEIKSARHVNWKYPKDVFQLYKSAEVHTVKRNLPWQLFAIPALIAVVVALVWSVFARLHDRVPHSTPAVSESSVSAASQSKKLVTAEEYVQSMMPVVPGMPWSAPAFADRKVRSDPKIYCAAMATDDAPIAQDFGNARCSCMSEQGTRIQLAKSVCVSIVKNGVYNPFQEPSREATGYGDPLDRRYYRLSDPASGSSASPGPSASIDVSSLSGAHGARAGEFRGHGTGAFRR